jgi:hypothetical protein
VVATLMTQETIQPMQNGYK